MAAREKIEKGEMPREGDKWNLRHRKIVGGENKKRFASKKEDSRKKKGSDWLEFNENKKTVREGNKPIEQNKHDELSSRKRDNRKPERMKK